MQDHERAMGMAAGTRGEILIDDILVRVREDRAERGTVFIAQIPRVLVVYSNSADNSIAPNIG